jgi:UDP-N-acetylglucosamine 2-epimerase (non-hydrolysing)
VFVVGNPVIDALAGRGVVDVDPDHRRGVLVTAHRPTNVDDPVRLARLVDVVAGLAAIGPVTFPVHPRTVARLYEHGLTDRLAALPGVTPTDPLPYEEMLSVLAGSRVVVTDSGGLQEEAAYLGVPAVVLRRSTPRWEGVETGTAVLTGITSDDEAARTVATAAGLAAPSEQVRIAALPSPYGDGTASFRVAAVLADPATDALLTLEEPDYTDGSRPWRTVT